MFSDCLLIYTKLPLLLALVYKVLPNSCSILSFFVLSGPKGPLARAFSDIDEPIARLESGVWSLRSLDSREWTV